MTNTNNTGRKMHTATFTRKTLTLLATAAGAALLAGCGNLSQNVAADGSGADKLVWPAAADAGAIHKGGTYPNVANLRTMRAGMSKDQVMGLIGEPHFAEGVGRSVREWDYLFNFTQPNGQAAQCEYKVLFGKDGQSGSRYWNPESCAAYIATPKPAAPAPEPQPAAMMQRTTLAADALFGFDQFQLADIKAGGMAQLNALARQLNTPEWQNAPVHVTGYTDRLGAAAYNQRLSEQRAMTVRDYLVSRGVAASRIRADGRGTADPVVTCSDQGAALIACLAPNRRVVIAVGSEG